MSEALLCDAIRTPIGRYAGSLSSVRADDVGAVPLKALMELGRCASVSYFSWQAQIGSQESGTSRQSGDS